MSLNLLTPLIRLVCFIFGHNVHTPHPNKEMWYCYRCFNSPTQKNDKAFEKYLRKKEASK